MRNLHPQNGSEGRRVGHSSNALQTIKPTVPIRNMTATKIMGASFFCTALWCDAMYQF
jgi:hypothetical protein